MRRRTLLLAGLAGLLPTSSAMAGPYTPPDQAAFDAWAHDYVPRAIRSGVPADVVRREFQGLTLDPHVVALDSQQPEFSRPVGDYVASVASEGRVAMGRRKVAGAPWLDEIQRKYGPPGEILVAVWAVETGFGANLGDFDVLRSLASLATAGRRRDWAEEQITALLRIIASGEATRAQLRGSWAGAMGQTQLEPTAFLDDAVDVSGRGKPDVWNSPPDALASAANLLQKAGWRRGEAWQREALLPPHFDYGLSEGPPRSVAAWSALGLKPAVGSAWGEHAPEAVLLLPAGAAGPAILAYPNHFVIRKYNNAIPYALGVGLLADRIAGRAGLVAAWPHEQPLSTADRIGAQTALAHLGYNPGPPDGHVGLQTRVALRAWQKARGFPADGYLTPHIANLLVQEAAAR